MPLPILGGPVELAVKGSFILVQTVNALNIKYINKKGYNPDPSL